MLNNLNEYDEGLDTNPSTKEAIDYIIIDMINRIASNDLNLDFTSKDINDILSSFEGKTGKHYSGEEREKIIEDTTIELRKRGYNIK